MKKLTLLTAILLMAAIAITAGCGGGSHSWSGQLAWRASYGVVSDASSYGSSGIRSAAIGSAAAAASLASLKEAITRGATGGGSYASNLGPARAAVVGSAGVDRDLWDKSLKYIYLNWEPLSGASSFTVYYLGPDGTQNEPVWTWPGVSPEDPAYNNSDPAAYLDLSDELVGLVEAPGSYQFRLTAFKGSEVKHSNIITVSIGTILNECPANPQYTSSRLSWTEVTAAAGYTVGYTVGLYKDSFSPADEVWRTPAAIPDPFLSLPPNGVTMNLDYYLCSINARAVNATGKIAEITNTISGFNY